MNRKMVMLVLLLSSLAAIAAKAQPAIPEVRFKVLYKATNKPVKWLFVDIHCERKLALSKRWNNWRHNDDTEYEKTYSFFGYYQTQDGWVTLPAIEAPGTTKYEAEIYAPACGYITYPCKNGLASPFNDENLPKFTRLPREKRVLYATYARDYYWGVPGWPKTYEGIQFALDAEEIYFSEWPTLMYSISPLDTEGSNSKGMGPYFKEFYYQKLLSTVRYIQRCISLYERRVVSPFGGKNGGEKIDDTPISPEKLADLHAKADELRTRLRDIVCKDLQEKKRIWNAHELLPAQVRTGWPATLNEWRERMKAREGQKEFEPPSKFLEDPFIQETTCEALQEFYQHRNEARTDPSGPTAVAPGVPSTEVPPLPPPGAAQQKP